MFDDNILPFPCKKKNIEVLITLYELKKSFKRELELKLGFHQVTLTESLDELKKEKLITTVPGGGKIKQYYQLTPIGKKIARSITKCRNDVLSALATRD